MKTMMKTLFFAVLLIAPTVGGVKAPPRLRRRADIHEVDEGGTQYATSTIRDGHARRDLLFIDYVEGVAENIDCIMTEKSSSSSIQGRMNHPKTDEECKISGGCSSGCCRLVKNEYLYCDTTNIFPQLQCVCNDNTRIRGMYDGITITFGGVTQLWSPPPPIENNSGDSSGQQQEQMSSGAILARKGGKKTSKITDIGTSFVSSTFEAATPAPPTAPASTPNNGPIGGDIVLDVEVAPANPDQTTTEEATSEVVASQVPASLPQSAIPGNALVINVQVIPGPASQPSPTESNGADQGTYVPIPAPTSVPDSIPDLVPVTAPGPVNAPTLAPSAQELQLDTVILSSKESIAPVTVTAPVTAAPVTTAPVTAVARVTEAPADEEPATEGLTTEESATEIQTVATSTTAPTTPSVNTSPAPGGGNGVSPNACIGGSWYWGIPGNEFMQCTFSEDCSQDAGECCLAQFCMCGPSKVDDCIPSF